MKICAISDLHGQLDFKINPVNLLFICGDIVPLKIQRNIQQSFKWMKNIFIPWCNEQPVEYILLVAGNHDFCLLDEAKANEIFTGTKIKILYNQSAEFKDDYGKVWKIWGSPACQEFGNWAFMYPDEVLESIFKEMPEDTDILITHDAPYGRNDVLLQEDCLWADGGHIGNKPLANVLKHKHPKYHFTGHLHSTDHNLVDYNGTKTACVSLLNENYEMVYKPLYLEI